MSQSAGPCGKLTFSMFNKPTEQRGIRSNFRTKDACTDYQRVQDGTCATDCLSSMVGICPVSLVVKTGKLEKGNCKDQGYTVPNGTMSQSAGPCGKLTFSMFNKPTEQRGIRSNFRTKDACTDYQR